MHVEHVEPIGPIAAPLYNPRHEHDACGVGFIADTDGRHASRVVGMALEALDSLAHRGARAADDLTGDGAGISIPLSPRFRSRVIAEAGVSASRGRGAALAMCFLPVGAAEAAARHIADLAVAQGLAVIGWRDVPVDIGVVAGRSIGETPAIRQAVVRPVSRLTRLGFARRLAALRRAVEAEATDIAVVSVRHVAGGLQGALRGGRARPLLHGPSSR